MRSLTIWAVLMGLVFILGPNAAEAGNRRGRSGGSSYFSGSISRYGQGGRGYFNFSISRYRSPRYSYRRTYYPTYYPRYYGGYDGGYNYYRPSTYYYSRPVVQTIVQPVMVPAVAQPGESVPNGLPAGFVPKKIKWYDSGALKKAKGWLAGRELEIEFHPDGTIKEWEYDD